MVYEGWPRPWDVWLYYERSQQALVAFARYPGDAATGMTQREFDALLENHRSELDQQTTLMIVASAEAIVRTDMRDRARRRRDAVGRALRELKTPLGRRRPGLRNILAVWAKHVRRKQRFDRFHALLELRDWLAHGRYWQQKSGIRQASPEVAWRICKALFDVLPGLPDLEAELKAAS